MTSWCSSGCIVKVPCIDCAGWALHGAIVDVMGIESHVFWCPDCRSEFWQEPHGMIVRPFATMQPAVAKRKKFGLNPDCDSDDPTTRRFAGLEVD